MHFNYFDIHSHLNLKPLYEQRADILARMREEKIGTITVGVDYETSKLNLEIADEYENVWVCVGLHPADNMDEEFDIEKYRELTKHPKVVAIGECGLDYFRLDRQSSSAKATADKQKEIFKKHIELAIEVGKPLMIHARPSKGSMDAYEDVLEILSGFFPLLAEEGRHEYSSDGGGDLLNAGSPPPPTGDSSSTRRRGMRVNFHFFVGDIAIAKQIIERGWTMSFDGPITFSHDYDDVIRSIPLENIMAETDAPFAAPAPYRGKTCEPWMVVEVVKKIAEIKDMSLEMVQKSLLENIKRTFDI